jgi:hypothetical protein
MSRLVRAGSGGSTRTDGGSSSKKLAIDPAVHKTLKSETKGYRQYLARYMVDEKVSTNGQQPEFLQCVDEYPTDTRSQ